MAHAKDKGASKNVKKKAQKSVKEKRAEKKAKKGTVTRASGSDRYPASTSRANANRDVAP
jgi:hypothetical protein